MERASTNPTTSQSEVISETTDTDNSEVPVLRLRLHKPKTGRKVSWTTETIDNEELNKKKSKCCCVYQKPLEFGESSSESEDECDNCVGHVEKHKKKKSPYDNDKTSNHDHCHKDSCILSKSAVDKETVF